MKDGKFVILCVDDDPDILESLKVVIESAGHRVASAASAAAAADIYRRVEPDLIIVDLMMEKVDAGTDFVKRARREGYAAPIYLLSAVGDALERSVDADALGVSGVFQKPIDPKVLLETIATRLRK
jgi:DNA-binding response OmpR family regulator